MEEERSRLQEAMGKMEARLGEQSRLLEQVGPVLLPLLRGLSPQHWAAVLCPGLLGAFPVSCPFLPLQGLPLLQPPEAPPGHPVQHLSTHY